MRRALIAVVLVACNNQGNVLPDECPLAEEAVQCSPAIQQGGQLQVFSAPSNAGVAVTAEADAGALAGYPATEVIDGWEITFTSILVTLDRFQLTDATEDSDVPRVAAEARGPFAVDVLKPVGTLAVLSKQNLVCHTPDLENKQYNFNFDVMQATNCARNVNLTGGAATDYQEMVQKGYSIMFTGQAVFRGYEQGNACSESIDYTTWPTVVAFRLGTTTTFQAGNCPGGVNVTGGRGAAKISMRSHLLFSSELTDTGTELFFDQIAARYANGVSSGALAKVEDFGGSSFSPFVQLSGEALPYRFCAAASSADGDQMTFNARGATATDYRTYIETALVRQVRFNGNQLCSVGPPSALTYADEPPVMLPSGPKSNITPAR